MKTEFDVVALATQLIEQWGEDAPRVSKVRLVELIAANNVRAAAFWREVMRLCEKLLAEHRRVAGTCTPETASASASVPATDVSPTQAA
jgi:hypothetical protein